MNSASGKKAGSFFRVFQRGFPFSIIRRAFAFTGREPLEDFDELVNESWC
jgi:hypothetical protein